MNVIICVFFGAIAFIVGFSFGMNKAPMKNMSTFKKNAFVSENEQLKREYRNFLNYDGSEQV